MGNFAPRRFKREEGSSLLEFAFVAVLFIVVLLAVVEMARMILVYTTMAQAARAGARYAIVHGGERTGSGVDGPSGTACAPSSCTQINTVVQNFASAGLLNTGDLTVTVAYPDGKNTVGSRVDVTVTYAYDPLVSYFGSILNRTLGSTSEGVIAF